jgi:hypothetical protein
MLGLFVAVVPSIAQKKDAKAKPAEPAAPVVEAPPFEGVVVFKKGASASKINSTVTLYIKGDRFMADEQGDKIQQKIIVDAPKKMIYLVMDKEKMVMDMQMEKMAAPKGPEARLPNKTTKTQKLAGYDCEQWIDKNSNGEVELWTSIAIGKLFIPEGQMGDGLIPSVNMRKLLKQGQHFPMLMMERDKTGKEITRLEVTSVEKKAVDEAVFNLPKDYQRMSMPGSEN